MFKKHIIKSCFFIIVVGKPQLKAKRHHVSLLFPSISTRFQVPGIHLLSATFSLLLSAENETLPQSSHNTFHTAVFILTLCPDAPLSSWRAERGWRSVVLSLLYTQSAARTRHEHAHHSGRQPCDTWGAKSEHRHTVFFLKIYSKLFWMLKECKLI